MAETIKNKNGKFKPQTTPPVDVVSVEPIESTDTLLDAFTPAELAALARVKHDLSTGRYSDITPEYKKLLFVKWLLDHDRIGS